MAFFDGCNINCFVPPHVHQVLKVRGAEALRGDAHDHHAHADALRGFRDSERTDTAHHPAPVLGDDAEHNMKREMYDALHSKPDDKDEFEFKPVRGEGQPEVDDDFVNMVYERTGVVYDMYFHVYRRDSVDGKGMPLRSFVHFMKDWPNAMWHGKHHAMFYGDGNDQMVKFTGQEIIGHELSHAIVQYSGGLDYHDHPGALNESFADVMGSLALQYSLKQEAHEADWLLGMGVWNQDLDNAPAVRSMKAPGTAYDNRAIGRDPQPWHMDRYHINTDDGNGAVHVNSGIPNHAFYLLAQFLGGHAWEKAGHIWYDTIQHIHDPKSSFSEWADTTIEMARNRFGAGSMEMKFTRRAWGLVGVPV